MGRLYLARLYIRYWLILIGALELFYVGIDFLQNAKNIPSSANIELLYLAYNSIAALKVTLPLSLVFATIAFMVYLIRSNELIALYALGRRPREILFSILMVQLCIIGGYIALLMTPAAYFGDKALAIADDRYGHDSSDHLFFKLSQQFVYMGSLHPLLKTAEDVRIFTFDEGNLSSALYAKKGEFIDNHWHLNSVKHFTLSQDSSRRLNVSSTPSVDILEGFRPKILDNIFEGKGSFSILDAMSALNLLHKEKLNIEKIKTSLYVQTVIPFFATFMSVFLFFLFPASHRFFNMTVMMIGAVLATLMVWGLFLVLQTLAFSGTASAELLLLFPMIVFGMSSFFLILKKG